MKVYWPDIALATRIKLAFLFIGRASFYSYYEAKDLIDEVGKSSALGNLGISSPLIDLVKNVHVDWNRKFTLEWAIERSYWFHNPSIAHYEYFDLSIDNGLVCIQSKERNGGRGQLRLHQRHVRSIFELARHYLPEDYQSWAEDYYPVGGRCRFLLRLNSIYSDEFDHVEGLYIDPDTHPSSGQIFFGDREQELVQLAAFCQLEKKVKALLNTSRPSNDERESAQLAVKTFRENGGSLSFFPDSGFCYKCDSNLTHYLANPDPGFNPTGCPCCGATWCD